MLTSEIDKIEAAAGLLQPVIRYEVPMADIQIYVPGEPLKARWYTPVAVDIDWVPIEGYEP